MSPFKGHLRWWSRLTSETAQLPFLVLHGDALKIETVPFLSNRWNSAIFATDSMNAASQHRLRKGSFCIIASDHLLQHSRKTFNTVNRSRNAHLQPLCSCFCSQHRTFSCFPLFSPTAHCDRIKDTVQQGRKSSFVVERFVPSHCLVTKKGNVSHLATVCVEGDWLLLWLWWPFHLVDVYSSQQNVTTLTGRRCWLLVPISEITDSAS